MNVLELAVAIHLAIAGADTVVCYNDPLPSSIVSPGASFAVQYHFPPWSPNWRTLERWGFVSNDEATVWPGAGALVIPVVDGTARWPTPAELASLQIGPFQASGDTTTVVLDPNDWIAIPPFTEAAIVLVLEIPSGTPTAPGVGTGFLAADKLGTDCSFFTPDGGASWYGPTTYEWAWAAEILEQTTSDVLPDAVSIVDWGIVKGVYR